MDPDSENYTKNKNNQIESGNMVHDVSSIFQPFGVRRRPILADRDNWQFVTSEFRFVLYCGIIFWAIYALSHIV
jgi:hypothetical protein